MTRADWREFRNANTNHEIDDSYSTSGEGSLHVKNLSTNSIEALDQSMVDQPIKGKIVSQIKSDTLHRAVFFRVVDKWNFYVAYWDVDNDNDYFRLDRCIDGKFDGIDASGLDRDKTQQNNGFYPNRIRGWVDSGGDFRVRWEVEQTVGTGPNETTEWLKVADDVIDPDPVHTEGGGIGIGGYQGIDWENKDAWFDQTKIYYPD